MAVTSRRIEPNKEPPSSHIVTAEQLSQAEPFVYRCIALALIVLSFTGTVLAFAGGASGVVALDNRTWIALAVSVAWQAACGIIQFVTCKRWYNPVYMLALIASAVPSFLGYQPLVAAPVAAWLMNVSPDMFLSAGTMFRAGVQSAIIGLLVHLVFAVVIIAIDIFPERIFVKH